ncbi:tRNA-intron lyase [Methanomassiliicoccus luminyensis]|uniref:tRNA-intron lyase n=1 Tax=Methanomassiliicoccus luminyensis TaxID=1080712 RepID=UPI00036229E2|nr:tRNA-intron lyase [Methanomassiliicoccus luminyensis]
MPGELVEDSVMVRDQTEASQIYNKGCYGYPRSGGALELDLLEAVYLVEASRLEVVEGGEVLGLERLISTASSVRRDFEIRYTVYRDLRQRGFVVKDGGEEFDFRVFPRGGTPASAQTKSWVSAITERSTFSIAPFMEELDRSDRTRKELLVAVVDEEGDITYYRPERSLPKGAPELPWNGGAVKASLLEDRVLVFDEQGADRLHNSGFYGKKIGRVMQLSLIEAAHLMDIGRIDVVTIGSGRRINAERFKKRAVKFQPDFDLRLKAYNDLRSRGLVVKTGFKYGSHFRVYDNDPDKAHASWLVHAVPADYETTWPEMSRAVRLAHGVKKEILFARVKDDGTEYMRLSRVRP